MSIELILTFDILTTRIQDTILPYHTDFLFTIFQRRTQIQHIILFRAFHSTTSQAIKSGSYKWDVFIGMYDLLFVILPLIGQASLGTKTRDNI